LCIIFKIIAFFIKLFAQLFVRVGILLTFVKHLHACIISLCTKGGLGPTTLSEYFQNSIENRRRSKIKYMAAHFPGLAQTLQ
jgi:hypothetical protein